MLIFSRDAHVVLTLFSSLMFTMRGRAGGRADDPAYHRRFEIKEARVARVAHRDGEVGGHAMRSLGLAGAVK